MRRSARRPERAIGAPRPSSEIPKCAPRNRDPDAETAELRKPARGAQVDGADEGSFDEVESAQGFDDVALSSELLEIEVHADLRSLVDEEPEDSSSVGVSGAISPDGVRDEQRRLRGLATTSNSMRSTPTSSAARNDGSVFAGASVAAPR